MDDFATIILSHGRANRVLTLEALSRARYGGKIYIVIDDEDKEADSYRELYGDRVVQFSKKEAARITDMADNKPERNVVCFARNKVYDLARGLGLRYIWVLDDDYTVFGTKATDGERMYAHDVFIKDINPYINIALRFLKESGSDCVAFAQTGDFIGGVDSIKHFVKRKIMNSFFFDVQKPVTFYGRINEDLTASVMGGLRGRLFWTLMPVILRQQQTQKQEGGLTEAYLSLGTYVKSMYSVLYAPSCVKLMAMGNKFKRIHHKVNWNRCCPKILREQR